MKIAVVGASSTLGQKIVLEAEKQGISVISVTDTPTNMVGNGIVLIKSFDALRSEDLEKCYAVIDLLSFADPQSYADSVLPFEYLQKIITDRTRLIAQGQCIFLYVDRQRQVRVYDTQREEIGKDRSLEAIYHSFLSVDFRRHPNWNILCPPLILDETGYSEDDFRINGDILPVGINGSSYISMQDYALGFVELLKRDDLKNCCCSVFDNSK